MREILYFYVITDVFSVEEQRQNPTAVMDALQVFDKKLREPMGQKYMGARSVEDLTAEPGVTKQNKESAADANGLPVLPPKSKDTEGIKSPTDKQKPVCNVYFYLFWLLPPPKKEVTFLVRSVCLSVRRITRKLVNGF